ncbi:MAG TPA: hypothetical protein VF119_08985, partial [Candidatus Limnocylindrales bacterium]
MTQSIVCSACGATVPYGRLSCQECGELLASVASTRRTPDVLREVQAPTSDAGGADVPESIVVSGAARWAADDDGFGAMLSETSGPVSASPKAAPSLGTFAAATAGGGAAVVAPTPGAYVPPAP